MSFWLPGVPDQSLWIVCALFFISDAVRYVGRDRIIVTRKRKNIWSPVIPSHDYRIAKRTPTFLNPLRPWVPAVTMSIFDPIAPNYSRRASRRLRVYARRLGKYQILSCAAFLNLFLLAPIITYYYGLGLAIRIALLLHIETFVFLLAFLIGEKRFWRMESTQLASFAFECFLCPGYFANVCRRLSLGWTHIPGSALNFVVTATAEDRERIYAGVQVYLDDISEEDGLNQAESEKIDRLRVHIRSLQIALEADAQT